MSCRHQAPHPHSATTSCHVRNFLSWAQFMNRDLSVVVHVREVSVSAAARYAPFGVSSAGILGNPVARGLSAGAALGVILYETPK